MSVSPIALFPARPSQGKHLTKAAAFLIAGLVSLALPESARSEQLHWMKNGPLAIGVPEGCKPKPRGDRETRECMVDEGGLFYVTLTTFVSEDETPYSAKAAKANLDYWMAQDPNEAYASSTDFKIHFSKMAPVAKSKLPKGMSACVSYTSDLSSDDGKVQMRIIGLTCGTLLAKSNSVEINDAMVTYAFAGPENMDPPPDFDSRAKKILSTFKRE